MSGSIIGRYALALAFGVALAAPQAFAQSSDATTPPFASQQQEQVAKNPATAQDSNRLVAGPESDLRNGAGEIVDPVYGIPLPGQEHYPD